MAARSKGHNRAAGVRICFHSLGCHVAHLKDRGCSAVHASIPPIVSPVVEAEACPAISLHGGQIDAQVEEVPNPGPAQVMGAEPGSGPEGLAPRRSARQRRG